MPAAQSRCRLGDYGFMQQRTVEDPDGHTWELFYMDMSKFPQQ
jgi:predicted lactoylglutathione lyase